MPVYEYECKECGLIFEADQRIVDPPLNSCRLCGGEVERLISKCSFVLKGDGWYITDHPSEERKKAMEKGKKAQDKTKSKQVEDKPEIKKKTNMNKPSSPASPSSA